MKFPASYGLCVNKKILKNQSAIFFFNFWHLQTIYKSSLFLHDYLIYHKVWLRSDENCRSGSGAVVGAVVRSNVNESEKNNRKNLIYN